MSRVTAVTLKEFNHISIQFGSVIMLIGLCLVGITGLEPVLTESKSVVLPITPYSNQKVAHKPCFEVPEYVISGLVRIELTYTPLVLIASLILLRI